MREAGQEIVVKKKKFVIEDHFDDCGEDLSSLTGLARVDGSTTADGDSTCSSEVESDFAHDEDLNHEIGIRAYPLDASTVAKPQPGKPTRGRLVVRLQSNE